MPRAGYSELYERIEKSFEIEDMTEERLQQWMTRGEPGKGISSGTKRLARELSKTKDIYEEAQKEFDITQITDLEKIRRRASESPVYKDKIAEIIEEKLDIVKEEERITLEVQKYRDEVDRIKELDIEEQKRLFKEGDKEERTLASVALRESSPKVIGGLISGESRRKNIAIRNLF